MAALTLSEKEQMASTPSFQERMKMAVTHLAHYFNEGIPAQVSDFNRRTQLRKRFGRRILAGEMPNMLSFCMLFLQKYQEDPVAQNHLNGDNQLKDEVLINGTWLDPTMDFFAGVTPGDELEMLEI
jgi:hypothetical protein